LTTVAITGHNILMMSDEPVTVTQPYGSGRRTFLFCPSWHLLASVPAPTDDQGHREALRLYKRNGCSKCTNLGVSQ
jgi:hypothetical protein